MAYFTFASFSKTSELYMWTQSLPSDCELIEFGQIHRGSSIVFLTSKTAITRPTICNDFFTTDGTGERFIKAYHKQNNPTVNHGLLIFESEKLSDACNAILKDEAYKNFELLEVSRNALPGGLATAIFVNVDQFKYPNNFSGAHIAQLNPQLKSLF